MDLFRDHSSSYGFSKMIHNEVGDYPSWGLTPKVKNQKSIALDFPHIPENSGAVLPRGLGRSYGDSCLNEGGTLLLAEKLDCFISFDEKSGVLICESGVTFDEILKVFVPKGWFLPVTPGTKFVTVGGAIANDVHGKNHHVAGNFGHHVLSFDVVRSDGAIFHCSKSENTELFEATIGGLGLTGLISRVELKLRPIKSAFIDQEQVKFSSFDEFVKLSSESEGSHEYTVSWVDCVNGDDLRGIFIRGNHSLEGPLITHRDPKLRIPFFMPNWLLNRLSVSLFNLLYYMKNIKKISKGRVHYEGFFYPLDAIYAWNKIYGKRGFYQYQFTVPFGKEGEAALTSIMKKIKQSKMASFLVVMKTFGNIAPVGMMSFPTPGITLALDFANFGDPLLQLMSECDAILAEVGGRVYPAKDARMSSDFFNKCYKKENFLKYVDRKFSSSFSRRVGL